MVCVLTVHGTFSKVEIENAKDRITRSRTSGENLLMKVIADLSPKEKEQPATIEGIFVTTTRRSVPLLSRHLGQLRLTTTPETHVYVDDVEAR